MSNEYEKFQKLKTDTSCIGLAREENSQYFCTPIGATIIGWDNGIHYVFINGFDEMVFAVNPDTVCDFYVYPLANNFSDFLGLILATKGTNALQQIIQWDKQQYMDFSSSPDEVEYASSKKVIEALEAIRSIGVLPMENPFEYVKKIQNSFQYSKIVFSDEFYDITGKEKLN